jgi:tRNA dimethylallyltransferase
LGYKELLAHLAGDCTLEEAVAAAVSRTRGFARRQRAWFRRDPRIVWLDAEPDTDPDRLVAALVALTGAG